MRIALFSDVHGNLEALEAVLADMEALRPDRVLFLGDAVGYGPDPGPCLERILDRAHAAVAGNHDWAVAGRTPLEAFHDLAREAILWTRAVLGARERDLLAGLPLTADEHGIFLAHASPAAPGAWEYVFGPADAALQFPAFAGAFCAVGHTHRPRAFSLEEGRVREHRESVLTMREGIRYIVDVGSVGQPRDRNPDAAYAVYDSEERRLSFRRIRYDVGSTQEKMRAARLPAFLIERLAYGA